MAFGIRILFALPAQGLPFCDVGSSMKIAHFGGEVPSDAAVVGPVYYRQAFTQLSATFTSVLVTICTMEVSGLWQSK